MEGVNTANSTSGGVVLGGGDMSMKPADNCNETTQKFPQSNSVMMRDDIEITIAAIESLILFKTIVAVMIVAMMTMKTYRR